MPIEVNCQSCGKLLRAPEKAAGKRAKCPSCGTVVEVPQPGDLDKLDDFDEPAFGFDEPVDDFSEPEDDYDDYDDLDDDYARTHAPPPTARTKRKPCPSCGEQIAVAAKRCRFCGETLVRTGGGRTASRSRRYTGQLTAVDWLLCLLCSGIGCIVGVVAMISGDSERGGKMVGFSILFGIVKSVLFTLATR